MSFVFVILILTLSGCQNFDNSPFTNVSNDGFEEVEEFINQTKTLIDEYFDILPNYDELRDGSAGCLSQDYMRTDQDEYNLSSNKDFYETNDRYIKANDVYRALINANNILEMQNDVKSLKEGAEYNVILERIYTVTYYLEGTDFYYYQSTVDNNIKSVLTLRIDLTENSETLTLTEDATFNGEMIYILNIELDLNQMTEISFRISDASIRYVEKDENNSMFVLIKYNANANDLDYSELLYFDAIANEEYHNIAISPDVLTYTKYDGDHIKYSFDINDVSKITYNMHNLDGWNVIRPNSIECDFVDVYLDDAIVLQNQNLIRKTGDQYYLIVNFNDETVTDSLLSLTSMSLYSDLTVDFIDSKQSFSFDTVLTEKGLVFTYEELRNLLYTILLEN